VVSGDRLLTDQIGILRGDIYGAARKTLVLNRFPTELGMQPQAFALGGGKDGF